jgi:hypothetical protein
MATPEDPVSSWPKCFLQWLLLYHWQALKQGAALSLRKPKASSQEGCSGFQEDSEAGEEQGPRVGEVILIQGGLFVVCHLQPCCDMGSVLSLLVCSGLVGPSFSPIVSF